MAAYVCDELRHQQEPVVNARQFEKLIRRDVWILFSVYSCIFFNSVKSKHIKDIMPNKVPRKAIKDILKKKSNMRFGANADLMVSFV